MKLKQLQGFFSVMSPTIVTHGFYICPGNYFSLNKRTVTSVILFHNNYVKRLINNAIWKL